eukprot:COSAG02_NODE_7440_length_3012_cov_1.154823_2_plen_51_part_01
MSPTRLKDTLGLETRIRKASGRGLESTRLKDTLGLEDSLESGVTAQSDLDT